VSRKIKYTVSTHESDSDRKKRLGIPARFNEYYPPIKPKETILVPLKTILDTYELNISDLVKNHNNRNDLWVSYYSCCDDGGEGAYYAVWEETPVDPKIYEAQLVEYNAKLEDFNKYVAVLKADDEARKIAIEASKVDEERVEYERLRRKFGDK
jgi:hypothetical protein